MRRSRMLAGVLGGLLGLPAAALATSFAYVVHLGGLLTVINTNSNTVETTLQVGGAGNFSYVAVNSDGSRVYTAEALPPPPNGLLWIIDGFSTSILGSVVVGHGPTGVAVNSAANRLYVADNEFGMPGAGKVSVIDTSSNTVIATVATTGTTPLGAALTPDGTRLYVAHFDSNTVSVIDTSTNSLVTTISMGSPQVVKAHPDGTRVYVTRSGGGDRLAVIDTSSNTVTASIPVGNLPDGIGILPDGTKVYVPNFVSSDVSVISTASNTVIATIAAGEGARGVDVTPDGARAYVANENNNAPSVTVIDTATDTVIATIPVGDFPNAVAVGPDVPGLCDGTAIRHATVVLKKLGPPMGDEAMTFKGDMVFPPGVPATFNPSAKGAQVLIEDISSGFTARYDLTHLTHPIPAGLKGSGCDPKDGWTPNATGTKHAYKNKSNALNPPTCTSASANGLAVVKFTDARATKGKISFSVGTKNSTIATPAGPLRVSIVMGASAADASAGECGAHAFPAAACAFGNGGTSLKCKQK